MDMKWKVIIASIVLLSLWLLTILILLATLSIPSVVEYLPFIGLESFIMPFLGCTTTLTICLTLIAMAIKVDKLEKRG
jgi:hypothetical protein